MVVAAVDKDSRHIKGRNIFKIMVKGWLGNSAELDEDQVNPFRPSFPVSILSFSIFINKKLILMPSSDTYLALYMFSLFIKANLMSSEGALIPFIAADAGTEETDYSIIFVMISISTLIAALLYKVLRPTNSYRNTTPSSSFPVWRWSSSAWSWST
jgi:hypothetical protein